MRLNLYWRGRDVIDVELHIWRQRPDDEPQPPTSGIEASGNGLYERAEVVEPDTTTFGFGVPR